MISKILTGLTDQEWLTAYGEARKKAIAITPDIERRHPLPSFSWWKQSVKNEARNRQNISYCISGVRISFKTAIRQVIDEVTKPAAEVPRQ